MSQPENMPALKSFRTDQIIFKEGEIGHKLYIIKQGSVKIVSKHESKIITLATLGEGACFGEMAVLSKGTRSGTAIAAADTLLYEIGQAQIDKMLSQLSPLFRAVIASFIKRIVTLNEIVLEKSSLPHPLYVSVEVLKMLKHHPNQTAEAPSNKMTSSGRMDYEIDLSQAADQISLNYDLVEEAFEKILGLTKRESLGMLEKLELLGLIQLDVKNLQKRVSFSPSHVGKMAKQVIAEELKQFDKKPYAELEYFDLADLAAEFKTDVKRLIESIAMGFITADAIMLKKSVVKACITMGRQ